VFRASFRLTERLREAGDWGRLLRDAAPAGVLVVAGFLDAKTVEAYLDVDPGTDVHAVTDVLAQRLGFDEYEVTAVEWLRIPPSQSPRPPVAEPSVPTAAPTAPTANANPTPTPTAPLAAHAASAVTGDRLLLRVHPGTITQVLVKPGGRALSIQVRHRRNEAVAAVAVAETDDTVEVAASVGTPEDDRRADFASFGVTFSWADADLAREVGARRIVHTDSGILHTESAGVSGGGIGPVVAEPTTVAEPTAVAEPTTVAEPTAVAKPTAQPRTRQRPMSSDDAPRARDAQGHASRTPFMLMLLVAFAVALFLSRRTRHR
jgi:hypothetical protein